MVFFWFAPENGAIDGRSDGEIMRCVELFTGCGGLALGLSKAGFSALRMSEWDKHAVQNVSHNRARKIQHVGSWPIHQEDVRTVDWSPYGAVNLVAGGPPCQPFSVGGRHQGHRDSRDMWPQAVRAVRETRPEGFLFENVRGLTREAFADYLEWVVLSLTHPDQSFHDPDDWEGHLKQLRQANAVPSYTVKVQKVNAADFGAAQQRHRVIIMGVRNDTGAKAPELRPTHSRERLLWVSIGVQTGPLFGLYRRRIGTPLLRLDLGCATIRDERCS